MTDIKDRYEFQSNTFGVFMSDKLTKYVYPISNTYFSMVLHIIFFIILFYIKVKSIEECDTDIVAQEEY